MKFGKLASIEEVVFRLPDFTTDSYEYLNALARSKNAAKFYIGCTGWSMKEWVGNVYPVKTKSADFLKYYAQQFNTIELNTTHYRIPNAAMIQKWLEQTPDDFRFCPKIPQSISHSRDLGLNGGNIDLFCKEILGLKHKLGCCFMQFPPYFDVKRLPLLKQFLAAFPSEIPLSIELRHESWFQKEQPAWKDLIAFCRTNGIATVITDVAGRRDVLHQTISNSKLIVRFVGNGLHPTDYTRVVDWIDILNKAYQEGLEEVYYFPHEPDNILAPQIAAYVLEQAKEKLSVITRGPDLNKHQEGQQMSLF
ncbi:MAG: DUF72 domain-containing protein [Bacteroidota bacterium]